ncbi:MAG: glycosyl transferase family A [Chitinophagales bacterium]|nr:MAG: glycosyl transferase family A [Chitinophagales bacterium]
MIVNNFFSVPVWVRDILNNYASLDAVSGDKIEKVKVALGRFKASAPEVSIVIPVYNEEKTLLRTLVSFSHMETRHSVELILVNNNSTDRTKEIAERLDVRVIDEPQQGISFARQAGLNAAKGKYFLNADGDSIYPRGWIDAYVHALTDESVACVYGTYSFFPSQGTPRMVLAAYEGATRLVFNLRRKKMDFFNVLGFNFAFRTNDGRKVGGFNTTRQRWSDAWMAMMLMEYGQIKRLTLPEVRVWTSDRRLMIDGGIIKSIQKRLSKEVKYHTDTPDFEAERREYKNKIRKQA